MSPDSWYFSLLWFYDVCVHHGLDMKRVWRRLCENERFFLLLFSFRGFCSRRCAFINCNNVKQRSA